jgi:putative ATPase
MDLFSLSEDQQAAEAPLAARMRPRTLAEFVGQEHIVGPGTVLRGAIERGELFSMILWGPPGCGKTTLARVIAAETGARLAQLSAVASGTADVRAAIKGAREARALTAARSILFIDEIHRFNKAQQDAFLSHVEKGDIVLIGATTENPSFEVNAALLSRMRVIVLRELGLPDLVTLLERALADPERGLGADFAAEPDVLALIARSADGDARRALNTLELAAAAAAPPAAGGPAVITAEAVRQALARRHLRYDRAGEEHYNLISALHKSLRDSDPHAGLYWLARMLAAGEDPLYVARRLVRFASEDVGNADPQALPLAVAAFQAYHQLGTPEGELALAQCAVYLATAPKSNAVYAALKRVMAEVEESGSLPPPLVIRNAPTGLMKELGYGQGYRYAHDEEGGIADQQHLPDELVGRRYYEPTDSGHEAEIARRMKEWERLLAGQRRPGR